VSENSGASHIESPAGIDLNPKPPNPIRVSKRAGALVFVIGTVILGLFAFGGYLRTQIQRATAADLGPKTVAPATSAGTDISKEVPSGNAAFARTAANPALLPPEETTTTAKNERVVVRQGPPTDLTNTYQAPPTPSPEEQERAAAHAREQQALAAPTSTRQSTASGWAPEMQPTMPNSKPDGASGLAALVNSVTKGSSQGPAKPAASEYDDQNMQAQKEAFLASARVPRASDYLQSTRTPPLSQYEIKAGWEIPAILEQAINSDLPGEIKALVMSNVYDTATGRFLLIPQGSRLIGAYDSHIGYGQDGVQAVWNRIIYPDGSSLDLDGMMGLDSHGNAGLRFKVDHHYKRLIGFAVLTSIMSAGTELSQSRQRSVLQYPSAGEIAGGAVGQETSQLGAQITRRNLNVQPAIKIPVGYKFTVRVNRDILFDAPYTALRSAR